MADTIAMTDTDKKAGTKGMLCIEYLCSRKLLAADWQNPWLPLDVDNSHDVTASDILQVVNKLNTHGAYWLDNASRGPSDPYLDVNGDGLIAPLDALLIINALNKPRVPITLTANLSATSDPNRNGIVLQPQISIVGQALPETFISVGAAEGQPDGPRVIAYSSGRFELNVSIEGITGGQLSIFAMDELGRKVASELWVQQGDIIQDWNAAVLNVIRDWTNTSDDPDEDRMVLAQPPMVARNLAMIHAAMFDAINSLDGSYQNYHYDGVRPSQTSAIAAGAAAAYRVATQLYPDSAERAVWNASLAESLALVDDGQARQTGMAFGNIVGNSILEMRSQDGSQAVTEYESQEQPGTWRRTPPGYLPPLLPHWSAVLPFAINDPYAFRPQPPPTLDSPAYAAAVDEVMRLGGVASTERTADESEIALFWSDGRGTATPPGHWNRIATEVIAKEQLALVDSARVMALLNIALADAGIAAWDAKYHYDLWRPVDAIRLAESDGNAATVQDATWLPLLPTPPFPTYTSGHSTFSAAAAAVLTSLFGEDYAFATTSDYHTDYSQHPIEPSLIVVRHFVSFEAAAAEAGLSRIYGGIHFEFDNTAGLQSGRSVGEFVVNHLLLPSDDVGL